MERQKELTGKGKYVFLTKDGDRMNPDHFRKVVWIPALEKAGLEYQPPIQTRHTFAATMLSAGEDIGWVQAMLGHSSLQMICTCYYAWIPKKTRNDGSAFLEAAKKEIRDDDITVQENCGKVIALFCKDGTKTTHHEKRVNGH